MAIFEAMSGNPIEDAINDYIKPSFIVVDGDIPEYFNNLALVFDVINNHSIQLKSNITDNWLENNSSIQDAITVNPIQMTLSGLVGEVVFTPPHTWRENILKKLNSSKLGANLTNKLGTIGLLLPEVDNYTQLAKNAVDYAETAYNHYKDIYQTIDNIWHNREKPHISKQEDITLKLQTAWSARTGFTVHTPFGRFENMYIQDISLSQGESNTVSNLSITLKQLKFAEIKITEADKAVLEQYASIAKAQIENQGKTEGTEGNSTRLYQIVFGNKSVPYQTLEGLK